MGWNKDKTIFTLDGEGSGSGKDDKSYLDPKIKEIRKILKKLEQKKEESK